MSYEAIVLCRRRPPWPPNGWPHVEGGVEMVLEEPLLWQAESEQFLGGSASHVVVAHCGDTGEQSLYYSYCEAIADASEGVMLELIPVMVAPRYRVGYRGSSVELKWSEIDAYIKRRDAEARAAADAEEARRRAAWDKNLETETDKHVLLDALLGLMRKDGSSYEHMQAMLEPEWLRQVTIENLRFLLGKHQELVRLQEANEGVYERWQAHVADKDD